MAIPLPPARHVVHGVSALTALLSLGGGALLIRVGTTADMIDREAIVTELGLWSLRLLLLSFAMSPLSVVTRRPWLRQCRRIFGLWGFAFAAAHALFYIWSVGLWPDQLQLLFRRLYLICGVIALLLLAGLAITSPAIVVQRIGPQARRLVHRTLYLALPLLLLHETVYPQDHIDEIVVHIACFTLLLIARVVLRGRQPPRWDRRAQAAATTPVPSGGRDGRGRP